MNTNLYKCPICGGPTNYSSINYQPQPCLHCCTTLQLKPAEHGENHGTTLFDGGKDNEKTTPAPTPWEVKEGYWYEQYQLMREKAERYRLEANAMMAQRDEARRKVSELQAGLDDIEEYGTKEINAAVDLRHQLAAALCKAAKLREALRSVMDWNPKPEYWERPETVARFEADMAKAREVLEETE